MADHIAGCCDLQPSSDGVQAQVAIRAGLFDDDQPGSGVVVVIRVDVFNRILDAVLSPGRTLQNVPIFVDQEQVVVVVEPSNGSAHCSTYARRSSVISFWMTPLPKSWATYVVPSRVMELPAA